MIALVSIQLTCTDRPTNLTSPDFKRGNIINIAFAGTAVILWFVQKFYYKHLNSRNARKWTALNEDEKRTVEGDQEKDGNRSVTFRYTT